MNYGYIRVSMDKQTVENHLLESLQSGFISHNQVNQKKKTILHKT